MKKVLRGQSIRDWLLFTLGINSALRVSDLLRLRERDCFDSKGRVLEAIRLREGKTDKEKVFIINKSAKKALEEYYAGVANHDHDPDRYLFVSRKGKNRPISRTHAWEILSKAARSVGINCFGAHSMRNYGTRKVMGTTIPEIA
jgi:integrase